MMQHDSPITLAKAAGVAGPGLITIVLLTFAEPLGIVIGALFAALSILTLPLALVPLLMVAAGFQQVATLAGLQVGWWIVLGAAAGVLTRLFFAKGRMRLEKRFVRTIVVFLFLAAVIGIMDPRFRFDRFATLIVLLGMLSVWIHILPKIGTNPRSLQGLHAAIMIGGVVVAAYLFLLITTGQAYLARGAELGLSLGVHGSSPSGISRMLAFTLIVTVLLAASGQIKHMQQKLFLIGTALICCFGMFYTGSRMPMFAAVIAITAGFVAYILLGRERIPLSSIVVIVALSVAGTFAAGFIASGESVTIPFFDGAEVSLRLARAPTVENNIRLRFWEDHFSSISNLQLLVGSGIGALPNPHSVWVGSLSTFGMIGLGMVLVFFLGIAWEAVRRRSILGCALLLYIGLSYSSSSDVDRAQFWILSALTLAIVTYKSAPSTGHWKAIKHV
ncbi:MAG: hypothetical protein AB8B94_16520 [Hyphomicrobiales bacterium]